jgi:hypothetical protein
VKPKQLKMKSISLCFFKFSTIILIFCFVISCKKTPLDKRNKYLGSWTFDVHYYSFTISDGEIYNYTETYDGKIQYGKEKSSLLIKYAADREVDLVVDEDGKLSGFSSHYSSGSFKDKYTLDIFLRWGGMGGSSSHSIKGIKKR